MRGFTVFGSIVVLGRATDRCRQPRSVASPRMAAFDLAIVGGGLSSARAIKSYRESGGEGRIALLSRDSALPYHRPPLSRSSSAERRTSPAGRGREFYRQMADVLLGLRSTESTLASGRSSSGTSGSATGPCCWRRVRGRRCFRCPVPTWKASSPCGRSMTPRRFERRLPEPGSQSSSAPASSGWRSPRRSTSSERTCR